MENENDKVLIEKWESLTFADNFIFWKILTTNLDICRELIEILLGREIERIDIPENEKTVKISPESRGIRFDVFAKNESESFDLEVQVLDKKDLPERARYYQGVLDVDSLPVGHSYRELKTSYILFLCLFDPFGKGLPVYVFENVCKEDSSIRLNDRSHKIFYNAKSCATMGAGRNLKNFLEFLDRGEAKDRFTETLNALVEKTKQDLEWRQHFMTLEVMKTYARMDGVEEGLQRGLKQGLEQSAKNALAKNLAPELVAEITGLSIERVKELAEKSASV